MMEMTELTGLRAVALQVVALGLVKVFGQDVLLEDGREVQHERVQHAVVQRAGEELLEAGRRVFRQQHLLEDF